MISFNFFAQHKLKRAFSWKYRMPFYEHMAAQVGNNIAIITALTDYRKRCERKKLTLQANIITQITLKMQNGSTFADSMMQWVPSSEAFAISSGEMSGNLSLSLARIIESNERISRIKRSLLNASTTPAIYGVAIYGFLFVLGNYIVPSLAATVNPEYATGNVAVLFALGSFFSSWWAFLPLILLGILIALVFYSFPRWTGKYRIVAEQYFPYSFYRDTEGFNWLMSFLSLLDAGVSDTRILDRQMKHASPWLRERLSSIKYSLENGDKLAEALDPAIAGKKNTIRLSYGFPNPDMIDNIASMYSFPDFSVRVYRIAGSWVDKLERDVSAMAKIFGFAAEMLMYVIIGFLIVAINSMTTQIAGV